jgi:photosystem II stability/assembly factor-like uncharacterized protein
MLLSRTVSLFAIFLAFLGAADSNPWRPVVLRHPAVAIASSGSTLWVCGADEMIAKSNDGGKNWEVKHETISGSVLLSLGFANEQVGWATGSAGNLLLTQDGGTSWKSIRVGTDPIYRAAFSDGQHGLIHTIATVQFTTDGGVSWTPVPTLKSDSELKDFKYVLSLAALDADHMAVLLKEGPAQFYDQRIVATQDGGKTFKTINIPNVGLIELTTHQGAYWAFGHEVIEKDKPGGGYGVPLVMHSVDAENWEHSPRLEHQFDSCSHDGCLFWDGLGITPFDAKTSFWTFPMGNIITPKWAMAGDSICTVGEYLTCSIISRVDKMTERPDSSSLSQLAAPPALGSSISNGPVCISCPYERIIVSQKASGPAEVSLKLLIAMDGTVSTADVVNAPSPEIGDLFAKAALGWVFEPFTKNGLPAQVRTQLTLKVILIKPK